MSKNESNNITRKNIHEWLIIKEATFSAKRTANIELTEADIYRYALSKRISLSIYFQSLVILRQVKTVKTKLKLKPIEDSLITQVCMLDSNSLINGKNLTISTKGKYLTPSQYIIDTDLAGYECVLLQRLLALSLNLPLPITGINNDNYGITVVFQEKTFQVFEKTSWMRRIQHQLRRLPKSIAQDINTKIAEDKNYLHEHKEYFPLHSLPIDACFVIRHSELEKLIDLYTGGKSTFSASTRISTPLSRLFWLACKHNEAISPLIQQPYKLLSTLDSGPLMTV